MMRLNLNGHVVDMVSIGKLAKMCGRSVITMRKYEDKKIMPYANYRTPPKPKGPHKEGDRVYTLELAKALVPIFTEEVKHGVKVSDDTKQKIKDLFTKERLKYATSTS